MDGISILVSEYKTSNRFNLSGFRSAYSNANTRVSVESFPPEKVISQLSKPLFMMWSNAEKVSLCLSNNDGLDSR